MNSIKFTTIPLPRIDFQDKIYHLLSEKYSPARQPGSPVLFPLILQAQGDHYRILYGFQAAAACRADQRSDVPAIVLPAELGPLEILELLCRFHRQYTAFTEADRARVIGFLAGKQIDSETLQTRVLPWLDLPARAELLKNYAQILELDGRLRDYLLRKRAPARSWFRLSNMDSASRSFLVKIVEELKPSLSFLEELAQNLLEIALREKITAASVIYDLEADFLLRLDEPREQKLTQIRDRLRQRRYPQVSRHQKMVEAAIKDLPFPESVKVQYDRNFEKKELKLELCIRNVEELIRLRKQLNAESYEQLKNLLELL